MNIQGLSPQIRPDVRTHVRTTTHRARCPNAPYISELSFVVFRVRLQAAFRVRRHGGTRRVVTDVSRRSRRSLETGRETDATDRRQAIRHAAGVRGRASAHINFESWRHGVSQAETRKGAYARPRKRARAANRQIGPIAALLYLQLGFGIMRGVKGGDHDLKCSDISR